jgi:hypothetical protein
MARPGRAIKGFLAAAPAAEERALMPSVSGGDERVRKDVPLAPATLAIVRIMVKNDEMDACAGRPAGGRRCKSSTVKA